MIYIRPYTTTRFQHHTIKGPVYISDSPNDPGFALRAELEVAGDPPKPTEGPHKPGSGIDFSGFVPAERAEYVFWSQLSWVDEICIASLQDQMLGQLVHTIEFALIGGEPDIEGFALWFLDTHSWTPDQESQRQRLIWAILFAASADKPGDALQFSPRVGLLQGKLLNAALSALLKHNRHVDALLAWAIVCELRRRRGETLPDDLKALWILKKTYSAPFSTRLSDIPSGFLQEPANQCDIMISPPHPDTARWLNLRNGRASRQGWDFLADPAQFTFLLEFADKFTRGFKDFVSQINEGRYIEWIKEKMRK